MIEPSVDGYRRLLNAELGKAILDAWTKLRKSQPADARAVEKYEIEGKSQSAIAEEEGVTRQVVNQRVASARAFLQRQLADFRTYTTA